MKSIMRSITYEIRLVKLFISETFFSQRSLQDMARECLQSILRRPESIFTMIGTSGGYRVWGRYVPLSYKVLGINKT